MVLLRAGLALLSVIISAVLIRPAVSEHFSKRKPLTEENLRRAAAVTAEDAGYHLALAALSEAGAPGRDPREALAHYRASLERNPADGRAWIGFARSLRTTGAGRDEIIHALRRALILERTNPDVIWYAGILALEEQEFAFGGKIFRRYLTVVPGEQEKVYSLFRALRVSPAFVIDNLLPEDPKYAAGYFDFLLGSRFADEAGEFWTWFRKNNPARAAYIRYSNFLIDRGDLSTARQVWDEFIDSPETKARGRKGDSVLWNGGFDLPVENGGFDWRLGTVQGLKLSRDTEEKFEGEAALRISLPAKVKAGEGIAAQIVPVQEKAKYRLSGYIRQQRLSLVVSGKDCPHFMKKALPQGVKDSWSRFNLDFETPRGCRTVLVQIVAEGTPSAGTETEMTAWVDSLEMVRTRL